MNSQKIKNPLTIFSEYKKEILDAKPDIRNFRIRKIKQKLKENLRQFIKKRNQKIVIR